MGKVLKLWAYRDSDGKMLFMKNRCRGVCYLGRLTEDVSRLSIVGPCFLDENMLAEDDCVFDLYRYRPPDVRLSFGGA